MWPPILMGTKKKEIYKMKTSLKKLSIQGQSLKHRVSKLADSEGKWITIRGSHILLKDGESPMDGLKRVKAGAAAFDKKAAKGSFQYTKK